MIQRNAIKIDGLVKRFGDITAVDGLSLEIREGEIFGLLGPNGAGKSTTINILSGLIEPTSGSATVGGFDITKEPGKVREIIDVCPQHSAYYKYLTGRENIKLFGDLHGMPKALIEERSAYLIEKIGLEE